MGRVDGYSPTACVVSKMPCGKCSEVATSSPQEPSRPTDSGRSVPIDLLDAHAYPSPNLSNFRYVPGNVMLRINLDMFIFSMSAM